MNRRKTPHGFNQEKGHFDWRKDDSVRFSIHAEMRDAWVMAAERCGYRSLAAFVRDAVCCHISNAGMGDLLVPVNDLPLNVRENKTLRRYRLSAEQLSECLGGRIPVPVERHQDWWVLLDVERDCY